MTENSPFLRNWNVEVRHNQIFHFNDCTKHSFSLYLLQEGTTLKNTKMILFGDKIIYFEKEHMGRCSPSPTLQVQLYWKWWNNSGITITVSLLFKHTVWSLPVVIHFHTVPCIQLRNKVSVSSDQIKLDAAMWQLEYENIWHLHSETLGDNEKMLHTCPDSRRRGERYLWGHFWWVRIG